LTMEITAIIWELNGMEEAKVTALKQILRSLVRNKLNNWEEMLPMAVFIYNLSFYVLINHTPFFVCHGREVNLSGHLPMALANAETSQTNSQIFAEKPY
jgi:hypothetical protein